MWWDQSVERDHSVVPSDQNLTTTREWASKAAHHKSPAPTREGGKVFTKSTICSIGFASFVVTSDGFRLVKMLNTLNQRPQIPRRS